MCFNSIGFMTLIYFLDYLICFIFKYLNFMFMMHFKASPPPALSVLHRIGFAYGKYPPRSQAAPSAGEASWKAQVVNVVKGGDLVEGKGVSFFFRRGLVYIHTE